jgi:hypothetical protein
MAAATTLPKKVAANLSAEQSAAVLMIVNAIKADTLDPEAILYVGEAVEAYVEKLDEADRKAAAAEKKAAEAKQKEQSRLPAAPKKKAAQSDDSDQPAAPIKLIEGRLYTSDYQDDKMAGWVLEFTGKFVASGEKEGFAKMRVASGAPEKMLGRPISVPVDTLKVKRGRPAAKDSLVTKKTAAAATPRVEVSTPVPAGANALLVPPFSRGSMVVVH